ncbi:AAA family ATPase [Pyrobaculum calidifontis]|uniref:ATPase AAA-type core domain-containing protein n=1 Tax=Pyrobaculum calidifontis (strain DSM 21063 / JCM 11548 / VA1) TaxID=410359 RepID=A3MVP5_PYRCJ|nr:AAA family ATPase [Pyrobaculum calidifontis]ABO08712.1 hypothetical protein Pcal_1288 [Pyrobaculum calidifontis JCM 11548]
MKLKVQNLKHITEAVLEGDRIILYGPNGGGKSTLIHTVALILGAALGVKAHDENIINQGDFHDDTYVRFEDFDVFEIRQRKLWWRGRAYPLTEPLKVADFSLWHITESYFAIYGRVPQCLGDPIEGVPSGVIGYSYFDIRVLCPAAAEASEDLFKIYYNVAEIGLDGATTWTTLSRLSYGQRRAIVILAALELGGYVLIENLESGLHLDLLVYVLNAASVSKGKVIAETHSGLALKLAVKYGIQPYYVERSVEKITNFDIKLFKREAEVFSSLI